MVAGGRNRLNLDVKNLRPSAGHRQVFHRQVRELKPTGFELVTLRCERHWNETLSVAIYPLVFPLRKGHLTIELSTEHMRTITPIIHLHYNKVDSREIISPYILTLNPIAIQLHFSMIVKKK